MQWQYWVCLISSNNQPPQKPIGYVKWNSLHSCSQGEPSAYVPLFEKLVIEPVLYFSEQHCNMETARVLSCALLQCTMICILLKGWHSDIIEIVQKYILYIVFFLFRTGWVNPVNKFIKCLFQKLIQIDTATHVYNPLNVGPEVWTKPIIQYQLLSGSQTSTDYLSDAQY